MNGVGEARGTGEKRTASAPRRKGRPIPVVILAPLAILLIVAAGAVFRFFLYAPADGAGSTNDFSRRAAQERDRIAGLKPLPHYRTDPGSTASFPQSPSALDSGNREEPEPEAQNIESNISRLVEIYRRAQAAEDTAVMQKAIRTLRAHETTTRKLVERTIEEDPGRKAPLTRLLEDIDR